MIRLYSWFAARYFNLSLYVSSGPHPAQTDDIPPVRYELTD